MIGFTLDKIRFALNLYTLGSVAIGWFVYSLVVFPSSGIAG